MSNDAELDGVKLPPISKHLKIDTFSSANIISISPRFNKEEAQKLHRALAAAAKSDTVQQAMKKVSMTYDGALGAEAKKKLDIYRDKVAKLQ
jgi:tripartite-type tricarboxylate transporter receptor subunit TctC